MFDSHRPIQVANNLESQRRQYALADQARQLGFQQVEVIDEDLGRSGSGQVDRPGFTIDWSPKSVPAR
jgi:DNA invertase Pin-like site-specific DNA recombinase